MRLVNSCPKFKEKEIHDIVDELNSMAMGTLSSVDNATIHDCISRRGKVLEWGVIERLGSAFFHPNPKYADLLAALFLDALSQAIEAMNDLSKYDSAPGFLFLISYVGGEFDKYSLGTFKEDAIRIMSEIPLELGLEVCISMAMGIYENKIEPLKLKPKPLG